MDKPSTEKLPGFGTNIFTVMSQLAGEHDAINLAQGFPDYDGPQALRDLVTTHMSQGHNQYAPLAGVPALREQIALKVERVYGCVANPETEITITPGATEALFCALSAVVHPGDEVVVLDPSYDCYVPGILLNGGIPRRVPLGADFSVDWQRVEDALGPRSRVLMLNSPHNPACTCFTVEDLEALSGILERFPRLLVISDEVYEHMVFDGRAHMSLLRDARIAERAFVVSSFGKTYHITGWRIGYCVAPASLSSAFRQVHQFINFSTNAPLSHAIADYMRMHPEFADELPAFYQQKRDLFCSLLKDTRFQFSPSAGTYFQLADYSQISDLPDTEFCRELTIQHGVAAIPVSVFAEAPIGASVVRFCFAKEDETLRNAVARLAAL